ncbi:hypothetical protein H310_04676 [Aphanomyces invadans]|uniref:Uncharacterized protein n=1 Tax=Aphanomyces invadans TaxID=157072 RepID=A0A024UFL9_9STRA|nr:hypothetical protein H310_04676 [Aphanomyces invadans]ETW04393.1 hypothetical protein H310_04676 [Aphanomyces invadans]|eukprot:XP_008867349.1 hypothetical protein H310_04676 [Aphanomyces invadans]
MGNKPSTDDHGNSLSCACCPGSTGLEHDWPHQKQPPPLKNSKHSSTLSMYQEASAIATSSMGETDYAHKPQLDDGSKSSRTRTRGGSFEFNVEIPEAFRAENLHVRRTSALRVSNPSTVDTTTTGPL